MDLRRDDRDQDVSSRVRAETHLAFGCGMALTLVVIAALLVYLWTA